jgi:hypothetical protein
LFLLPDFPLRDMARCQTKLLEAAEADEPQEQRMKAGSVPQGEPLRKGPLLNAASGGQY